MTSSITRRSTLAPDAETFLRYLQFLGPLMRTVMARWARTQELNMTQQLRSGIRYFDLRLATRSNANSPYFVHGLYGCNVMEPFKELKEFVDKHPKEVNVLFRMTFFFRKGILGRYFGLPAFLRVQRQRSSGFHAVDSFRFRQQIGPVYAPHGSLVFRISHDGVQLSGIRLPACINFSLRRCLLDL